MLKNFPYIDTAVTFCLGLFSARVGAKAASLFQNRQTKAEKLKEIYSQFFAAIMGLINSQTSQTHLAALCAVERACFDCSAEAYQCMCSLIDMALNAHGNEDAFFLEIERLHELAHQDIAQYESNKGRKNCRSNGNQ